MEPESSCPHCAAPLRAAVRPGPSGAFRLAALQVRCRGCNRTATVPLPRAPAPASDEVLLA